MSAAVLLLGLWLLATPAPGAPGMAFDDYLSHVGTANLELAAQRLNVPIAEAQISLARVFPEPVLSAGVGSLDLSNVGAPNTYDVGLSQTIEIGGKRGGRAPAQVRGRVKIKARPSGKFSAQMRPPWASMMPLQIDRPRPVPVTRSAAVTR